MGDERIRVTLSRIDESGRKTQGFVEEAIAHENRHESASPRAIGFAIGRVARAAIIDEASEDFWAAFFSAMTNGYSGRWAAALFVHAHNYNRYISRPEITDDDWISFDDWMDKFVLPSTESGKLILPNPVAPAAPRP